MKRIGKQRLRSKLGTLASHTEIYLTFIILIGVVIYSGGVIKDLVLIVRSFPEFTFSIEEFLGHVLTLIIAIEFIKMLAKHTPGSAVEVLLFAIARKLIIHEGTMIDSLIGVAAIAILFAVRKYFFTGSNISQKDGNLFNGGITMNEFGHIFSVEVEESLGHTLAGFIHNHAIKNNDKIDCGYEVEIGNRKIQVQTMDETLIKQVKVFDLQ